MRVTVDFDCDVAVGGTLRSREVLLDVALCAWQSMKFSPEGVITVHDGEEITCFTVQDVEGWAV